MRRGAIKSGSAKGGGKTGVVAQTPPAPPATDAPAPKTKTRRHPAWRALSAIASLRLTVFLMALGMFLVFAGTLAQIDAGIWSVVRQYFRSYFVWIPLQLFVKFGQKFFELPADWTISGSLPYPGGLTIGFALLFNLLAAHAVRFKLSWKRSGIIVLHAGLILMLVGEFITGQFAVEGNMVIENRGTSNNTESRQKVELAIVKTSDPKENVEVVIPTSTLRKGGRISHEALPFDVVVDRYYANSTLANEGGELVVAEKPVNSGASASSMEDMPVAYITLKKKGSDETIKQFVTSLWFTDWQYRRLLAEGDLHAITAENKPNHTLKNFDGETYDVALRWQRTYKPYTIALEEFRHDLYPGTTIPKNFSSKIHLVNEQQQDDRETTILMNSPMRYRGETFYQSGVLGADQGTVLQVVRNPGWLLPYLSCALVTGGMLIHFGMYLINYLRRRAAV